MKREVIPAREAPPDERPFEDDESATGVKA